MRTLIYGRQPVREVLRAGRRECVRLYVAEGVRPGRDLDELLALAESRGIEIQRVENRRLAGFLESGSNHQGVAIETGGYPYVTLDDVLAAAAGRSPSLVLLLDRIQDPQNLGAILRSADGAGAGGVIIPREKAAHVTPAVVRASAGAAEHVRVVIEPNLARVLDRLKLEGYATYALEETPAAINLAECAPAERMALVVGSEGLGIRQLVMERCDVHARIPMRGSVNSLNASTAAAIAMYRLTERAG
jgi:23S rRNA (guanosine2251-2'-O)-methyltransferase